ncbi:MAG: protein kinase [Candidatus Melainabacteria bacterium]|nr:protein kinase [Candidatus Melainabacteria bacterium]
MAERPNKQDVEKVRLKETCAQCGAPKQPGVRARMTGWIFSDKRQICRCNEETQSSRPSHEDESIEEDLVLKEEASLSDRFQIVSLLGEGGMGRVYEVYDRELSRKAAVKIIRRELMEDEQSLKRFQAEARATQKLAHERIVKVYDNGINQDGKPFIVMELLSGITLDQMLKEKVFLDQDQVLDLFKDVCESLEYAHEAKIIHRDLKPSNIFLEGSDEAGLRAKLIDFGIAKIRESKDSETNYLTQTEDIFGSPLYMSPEQGLGEKVSIQSDIYSLGCILYEALSGRAPFADDNPIKTVFRHLNEKPNSLVEGREQLQISKDLEQVVFKCLEKNPANRYASAGALKADLEKVRGGSPVNIKVQQQIESNDLREFDSIKRVLAFALDLFLAIFVASTITFIVVDLLRDISLLCHWAFGTSYFQSRHIPSSLEFALHMLLYFLSFEYFFRSTPGKMLFGLVVTDRFGGQPSFPRLLLRSIIKSFLFPFFIFWFLISFAKRVLIEDRSIRQAALDSILNPIHDRLLGTRVKRGRPQKSLLGIAIASAVICLMVIELLPFDTRVALLNPFGHTVTLLDKHGEGSTDRIYAHINPSHLVFAPRFVRLVRETLIPSSSDVKTERLVFLESVGTKIGEAQSVLIQEMIDGSEVVVFDETETIRNPERTTIVARTTLDGATVASVSFSLGKGDSRLEAEVLFPDGRVEHRKISASEARLIATPGMPISLFCYNDHEENSWDVTWATPFSPSTKNDITDPDLIWFIEHHPGALNTRQLHVKFNDNYRDKTIAAFEAWFSRLDKSRAARMRINLKNPPGRSCQFYKNEGVVFDAPVEKGRHYMFKAQIGPSYPSVDQGIYRYRVTAGGKSQNLVVDTRSMKGLPECEVQFDARSNVERFRVDLLDCPRGEYGFSDARNFSIESI